MKATVTGRHMDVTEVLKRYSMGRVERLTRHYEQIHRAEIIFTPERDAHYSAELILHASRGGLLVVHARDKTATAAFDIVLEKVERVLTRLKERLRSKSKAARARRTASGEAEAVLGDASGDGWW